MLLRSCLRRLLPEKPSVRLQSSCHACDAEGSLTFFIVVVFRNNNGDRLANCFFGGVAEDALCAFIPAYDNAIEILAYDYVIARLHDRRNPTQSLFTFAQRVLELLALGNI